MASFKLKTSALALGLLVSLALTPNADAEVEDHYHPDQGDIYSHLTWNFSVPVKLKNMMSDVHVAEVTVNVYGPNNDLIGRGGKSIEMLGGPHSQDTVLEIWVDPMSGKDPFKAERYTVDLTFDRGEVPSHAHQNIAFRAKPGTSLVHRLEAPMPAMPAASIDDPGAGMVGQTRSPRSQTAVLS